MSNTSFCKVDHLLNRLSTDYPILKTLQTPRSITTRISPKSYHNKSLVRPTMPSSMNFTMLNEASKYRRANDLELPKTPKHLPPITVKINQYEVETGLDCFMKHIATKSYARYVSEQMPGFRKGAEIEIKLEDKTPRYKRKPRKIEKLNLTNLETLGQRECSTTDLKLERVNLNRVKRRLNRNVKQWCLDEIKNKDNSLQLIDHYTFKI